MEEKGPLLTWVVAIATVVALILTCWQIRVRMARKTKEQDRTASAD
jgi:hypothetical protein